jgi:hypothetical protein
MYDAQTADITALLIPALQPNQHEGKPQSVLQQGLSSS